MVKFVEIFYQFFFVLLQKTCHALYFNLQLRRVRVVKNFDIGNILVYPYIQSKVHIFAGTPRSLEIAKQPKSY